MKHPSLPVTEKWHSTWKAGYQKFNQNDNVMRGKKENLMINTEKDIEEVMKWQSLYKRKTSNRNGFTGMNPINQPDLFTSWPCARVPTPVWVFVSACLPGWRCLKTQNNKIWDAHSIIWYHRYNRPTKSRKKCKKTPTGISTCDTILMCKKQEF